MPSGRPAPGLARAPDPMALVILAFLEEQPRHPYEIQRLIRERHVQFAAGRPRALYHAVDRLAAGGLIEPVETSREGRRPERTVYRVTEAGREEFRSALVDLLAVPERAGSPFAVALTLAAALGPAEVGGALRRRAVSLEAEVASLEAAVRGAAARLELPRVLLLEVEYILTLRRAELDWTSSVAADIGSGRLRWDPDGAAPPP